MKLDTTPSLARDLLLLSSRLDKANTGWKTRSEACYWQFMFHLTRILEKTGYPRRLHITGPAVLNFGCGLHSTPGIDSDLFALHRYLPRRSRPDIYLTGTCVPRRLTGRFDAVVCEHVLEHMLPAHALVVLRNLVQMLKTDGSIQISVPSPARCIDRSEPTHALDIVTLNDIAYNYGHKFLYDERTLAALIAEAGCRDVRINSYLTSPWKDFLLAQRERQSIYVMARRP